MLTVAILRDFLLWCAIVNYAVLSRCLMLVSRIAYIPKTYR
jgi:hypothetical protein